MPTFEWTINVGHLGSLALGLVAVGAFWQRSKSMEESVKWLKAQLEQWSLPLLEHRVKELEDENQRHRANIHHVANVLQAHILSQEEFATRKKQELP